MYFIVCGFFFLNDNECVKGRSENAIIKKQFGRDPLRSFITANNIMFL